MDLHGDRKEFEPKTNQNATILGYKERTSGSFGIFTRMHYKGEISKSDGEDENNNPWMDEILGKFDCNYSDLDMTRGLKPEIKTNYQQPHPQATTKNLYSKRK